MPTKRKTKKRKMVQRSSMSSPSTPLKSNLKVRMKYIDFVGINPGAGFYAPYVFSCNGLYDPNISGLGHQPRGFDQLMTMYDHYVVTGATCKVTFFNKDTTNDAIVGIMVKDSSAIVSDGIDVLESGSVKYTHLTTQNPDGTLTVSINPNKFLGRPIPLSDPQLKGSTAANPAEQCYFHVFAGPIDNVSDLGLITMVVELTYTAILIEPKQPASS